MKSSFLFPLCLSVICLKHSVCAYNFICLTFYSLLGSVSHFASAYTKIKAEAQGEIMPL